jgi:hypothetical protein
MYFEDFHATTEWYHPDASVLHGWIYQIIVTMYNTFI